MSRLEGFAPIAAAGAHTLILGSMPGAASLAAVEYYAHPRNHFWPIIGAVLGIDPALPYAERTRRLAEAGYALWDVLGACRREGSLDSNIQTDSIEVNDFAAFFVHHPAIDRVFCNGTAAEQCFRRHALPVLGEHFDFTLRRLPSTSPANASIPYPAKLAAWREIARCA
ncbi:MAG: DNA-deoxyinosine glycosylase [Aromatoleum sp.]|jgi:hypoxanthine-DNA glycosylase|uniref:DNA-deoxyinosine glycosylase n=1 Tax=Aromatoleum sp. TaxID=2307007 RepID=UPI00289515CB|nr:DNA-deoxyinosine glycosylase [Aromatoleum sp.]MDT3670370.1 DNA-deoxyinosine glycosylase [Aromatoleum sp.]